LTYSRSSVDKDETLQEPPERLAGEKVEVAMSMSFTEDKSQELRVFASASETSWDAAWSESCWWLTKLSIIHG
jgi:hypothetical protein